MVESQLLLNLTAVMCCKHDVEQTRVTRRVVNGMRDERKKSGNTDVIYRATDDVCEMSNGGGVIGYLSKAPLDPGVSVHCDLTLYRFGTNFVCSVRVGGEIFLYPAFSMSEDTKLSAFVGQETDGKATDPIEWSRLRLDVLDQPAAA